MFSWGAQAQAQAKPGPPAPSARKKFDASDYPRKHTFRVCCVFFLFLLYVPISFLLFYHTFPTTVITLALVWLILALGPWAFHAGGSLQGGDVAGPMLTLVLFLSVVLAFFHGVGCYYSHAQPLRQLMYGREYRGVYPETPGVAFPDAAYIEFAGKTFIDKSKGVSYQSLDSGLTKFCIAPIATPDSVGRYGFWAIGVDCCGDNGEKFECHDADQADVKTGWVLPHTNGDLLYTNLGAYLSPNEERRDLFVKALEKAEAKYEIASPGDDAVFVKWTKEKRDDILAEQFVHIFLAMCFSFLWMPGVAFLLTRLYQRFKHVKKIHRMQHKFGAHGHEAEEEDLTERVEEFMNDAMEHITGHGLHETMQKCKTMLGDEAHKDRPQIDMQELVLWGMILPYVTFIMCVVISTYAPCSRIGGVMESLYWCVTFVFVFMFLLTPQRQVTGIFLLICCFAGYYIGQANYKENMFHYCAVENHQSYTDVRADEPTDIFWDAGKLKFDDSSRLSTDHSVGFLYQGVTYCAAPVISINAPCNDPVPPPSISPITEAPPADATEAPASDADTEAPASEASEAPASDSTDEAATSDEASDASTSDASLLQVQTGHMQNLTSTKFLVKLHNGTKHSEVGEPRPIPALNFMQRQSTRRARSRRALETSDREGLSSSCKKPMPQRVEFWAVGQDCCESRKKFWCDGGEDKGAREAVVVRPFRYEDPAHPNYHPKTKSDRLHYLQAVNQALAVYDLPEPENHVLLLRWGESSDDLAEEWRKRAVGVLLISTLVSLLVILLIGISSFCYLRRQRQMEETDHHDYNTRAAGKATEKTVFYSPRPSLPSAMPEGDMTEDQRAARLMRAETSIPEINIG